MVAYSVNFQTLAIQEEAFVCCKLNAADAKRSCIIINQVTIYKNVRNCTIQFGGIKIPQYRVFNDEIERSTENCVFNSISFHPAGSDFLPRRIKNNSFKHQFLISLQLIFYPGDNIHFSL